jgi:hypothetical protein
MTMLCASQDQIDVTFDNDGDLILTQTRWPDEDQTIIVSRDNIDVFIDKLTDAVGIPCFGRPAPTAHRFDHLVDDTERQESGFIDAVRTELPALPDLDQKMAPKDPKAAERQRRRREKHRHRDTVTDTVTSRDTERDTVTVTPLVPELELDGGQNKALAH